MIAIPFLGALLEVVTPLMGGRSTLCRWIAITASLMSSLVGIVMVSSLHGNQPGLQINEVFNWVGSYAMTYDVGLDGLNVLFVILISIVFPLLVLSEWNRKQGAPGVFGLFLLLQTGFLGSVVSQDLFLMVFFWSFTAVPLYFLFAVWGGQEREASAFRFITMSALGNALFLMALVIIYFSVEPHSFSIKDLMGDRIHGTFDLFGSQVPIASIAFLLLSMGIACRLPLWPFHGWFTFQATQSPASFFVLLSAITAPIGLAVFARLALSLFPAEFSRWSHVIVALGAINVIFGALMAVSQRELRLLMAYAAMTQMGVVLVGLGSRDSAGVVGAIYQLLVQGLALTGFGFFVGSVRDRMGHSAFVSDEGKPNFGGWVAFTPFLALLTALVFAGMLGLPGLGGFIGQSLIMMGSYSSYPLPMTMIALGVFLIGYQFFSVYRSIFLGAAHGSDSKEVFDLSLREKSLILPIVFCLIVLGFFPRPLLELVRPSVAMVLSMMK